VGRKTAERIILELRDKLSKDMGTSSSCETQKHSLVRDDAVSALVNLGYKKQVAEGTVLKIKVNDEMKIEELIKMALRELNRI
jgi:Holliday junction DNA helicase RuvA